MERLTYRDARGEAWYADSGTEADLLNFIADIEDILGEDYDLDRLREIVEADRDGRCFTTTVKVGDYIFFPYDEEIVMCRVQGISLPVHGKNLILHLGGYPAVYMYSDRENIDWWKTREAAEAALKGKTKIDSDFIRNRFERVL